MDDKSLLQQFAGVIEDFAEWLGEALNIDDKFGYQRSLQALADDLGVNMKPTAPPPYALPSMNGIKAYRESANPGLEAWFEVAVDVRAFVESLLAIHDAFDLGGEATTEEFTQALLDLLATNYVRQRWPRFHAWLEFARFSTEPMTIFGRTGAAKGRFASSLVSLVRFVLAPVETLGRLAFASDPQDRPHLADEDDARKVSDSTLLHLAGFLAYLGHTSRDIGLDGQWGDEVVFNTLYGWDQPRFGTRPDEPQPPEADVLSERMLSLQVRPSPHLYRPGIEIDGALRLSMAWVPKDHGGPGFFLSAGGTAFKFAVDTGGRWTAQADARFDAPFGLQFGGQETFRLEGPIGDGQVHATAALMSKPAQEGSFAHRFTLGGDNGLSVGRMALATTLGNDGIEARASFLECRLALDGTAFDDFIGSLLPSKNTSVDFSFGMGVSSKDGFFTTGDVPLLSGQGRGRPARLGAQRGLPPSLGERRARWRAGAARRAVVAHDGPAGHAGRAAISHEGPATARGAAARDGPSAMASAPPALPVLSSGADASAGIPIQIPIGKSLGPLRLHHALLNISKETSGNVPRTLVRAALSFSAQVGPALARVDQLGLKFALDFPEDKRQANLHFANVDVGFVPPTGIGIAVDAKQVKGGGFLFVDAANHQYAGVMELEISNYLAVKAFGLIATRLPDGSKGFSLLVMVTAENTSDEGSILELSMNWRLTGIGGLLAIHRTISEDALRAGLKNRTLESILFPKDPVRNAPTILAALNAVFPPNRGSYMLGFMVRLVWGVPKLLTIDLALIVEWGARERIVLLGRISAILPRADHDLLRLNLDAIGVFDLNNGTAAIDAVLVDSRLLNRFAITGAAALRARWSSPRSFAVAVGGMNKGFTLPANFPKLERVTLNLSTSDNPRIVCEAYIALTSNTVQLGAHAHLQAASHGFSVTGEAGFDVLIRLLPFHFLAEFYAGMQLKKGSRNLFKVKVEGALEGPLPLAVRCKATFEILWWDVTLRVNVTLVGGDGPPLPAAVNAFAQLRAALAEPRSWSAELPAGQTRIVTLAERKGDDATLVVHPLGTLTVRQGAVPLNLARDIDKFGESPVEGPRRFAVTRVTFEGDEQVHNPLDDDFAPAQFFEMSDEAKLASPSYEPMNAGVRVGSNDFTLGFAERAESPLEYETRVIDEHFAPPASPPPRYRVADHVLRLQARFGAAGLSVLRRDAPLPRAERPEPFAALRAPTWAAVADNLLPVTEGLSFAEANAVAGVRKRRQLVREFEVLK